MSISDIKIKKKASIPQYFKGLFMASRSTMESQATNEFELSNHNASMDRTAPVNLPRYVPHYTVNSNILANADLSDEPPRTFGDVAPFFQQNSQKVGASPMSARSPVCTKKVLAVVVFLLIVAGSISVAAGIASYFALKAPTKGGNISNFILNNSLTNVTKSITLSTLKITVTTTKNATTNTTNLPLSSAAGTTTTSLAINSTEAKTTITTIAPSTIVSTFITSTTTATPTAIPSTTITINAAIISSTTANQTLAPAQTSTTFTPVTKDSTAM